MNGFVRVDTGPLQRGQEDWGVGFINTYFSGGNNSDWLLPNRLYEGGYFGIPAIAAAQHETGRYIQQRQIGVAIDPPFVRQLKELLVRTTPEDYREMRRRIEDRPLSDFVDTGDIERMTNLVSTLQHSRITQE